jgi:hypothetical protein
MKPRMHHLIIGPRRVVTACGIRVAAYYPMSKQAMPANAALENISCTPAPDSERVEITCPKCRLAAGRSSVPSTQSRCAKCDCETKGEAALVGSEIWCHPCADGVAVPSTDITGAA